MARNPRNEFYSREFPRERIVVGPRFNRVEVARF